MRQNKVYTAVVLDREPRSVASGLTQTTTRVLISNHSNYSHVRQCAINDCVINNQPVVIFEAIELVAPRDCPVDVIHIQKE